MKPSSGVQKTYPLWIQGIGTKVQPVLIFAPALQLSNVLTGYANEYKNRPLKLALPHLIVRAIAEYLNLHNGIEPPEIAFPLRSNNLVEVCFDPRDATFINRLADNSGLQNLYELTDAAMQLHIDSLLSLCCAKIAARLKGQPCMELQRLLQP